MIIVSASFCPGRTKGGTGRRGTAPSGTSGRQRRTAPHSEFTATQRWTDFNESADMVKQTAAPQPRRVSKRTTAEALAICSCNFVTQKVFAFRGQRSQPIPLKSIAGAGTIGPIQRWRPSLTGWNAKRKHHASIVFGSPFLCIYLFIYFT